MLADEINRATPRTQSALLESMSERQVSADGQTHPLPRPFMVIATENPVEFEGTYPLPESQLDRFLLRIPLGYPATGGGVAGAGDPSRRRAGRFALGGAGLRPSGDHAGGSPTGAGRRLDQRLPSGHCRGHAALRRVAGGRQHARARWRCIAPAQAAALVAGRPYVVPDDVKQLAVPVLAHRVIPKGYLHGGQREAVEAIVERLVEEVPVPA